ncbi:hypothetical protein Pcinc_001253 [Petrolisthes cinctipes]|uniref:Uncharacterized protein n=1 Tax=Petrolisthes cinctipes TaxID=88211 RepID=A0AAE1GLP5_PETCI|nr:hypothetical protein Pcinc_001253 [Petrolisthes cinctipes]
MASTLDGIFHVGQLEEEVRARTQEVQAQTAKYELVSSALRLSQERVSALEDALASMETHSQQAQEVTLTLQKENRETLERTLREHNDESRTLQKTITQLEAQVDELQFVRENQKKQIFDLKETVCSLQSEVKGIRLECEDVIATETGKHKEKVKELEQQQNTQMLQLRSQHSQTESEWRESLRVCEAQCSELNAEMVTLRSTLSSERTSTHTHLQSLRQQLRAEHSSAVRSLEEQLQLCVERHEEAEDRVRALSATNTALTATNTRLKAEILTLTNELAEMRANVDKKNEEVREAEKKVRLEYSCQEEELRQCKEQSTKLRNSIVELKSCLHCTKAEAGYAAVEGEALAVVWCLQKARLVVPTGVP